ncbi:23S rRNA (uracil(1939)-C(5))-methyltransferase RlmD [Marinobacterium litorale]|uniref:23S rRNA (uracil(1939)-C(5))-methyltransferase RlmD n=1 Tax=Marinobacterium litorale TaxID=404770 RepID=UPI0003F5D8F7|nr:23S rRNA (uracil(1939)-C(5))-methyltransferase RlmD [Marinobacterium litorale]
MNRKRIQFGGPSRRGKAAPSGPVQLDINNLSGEGRGVGRSEGKTVFVEGALPGERVDAEIIRRHKRFDEARLIHLLAPSSERQSPPCQYYGRCGGCQLQHLESDAQIRYKQAQVLEQLQRFAGIQPQSIEPALHGDSLSYRRTARIGINQRGDGEVIIGFRQSGTHRLQDIESCPVLLTPINQLIGRLRQVLSDCGKIKHLTHAEVSWGDDSGILCLRITRRLMPDLQQSLLALTAELGFQLVIEDNDGHYHLLDPNPHTPTYTLKAQTIELEFEAGDFLQVNPAMNAAMVERAVEWLSPSPSDRVLDLFCGLGNFTLPLARHAASVIGVEGSETMVNRARSNAARNGITNVELFRSDLSADIRETGWYHQGQREGFDLILLDPPRTGAAEAIDHLVHYQARRILYIACDPGALVRDAKALQSAGYHLTRFCIVDMFPHTAHVESMALFEC